MMDGSQDIAIRVVAGDDDLARFDKAALLRDANEAFLLEIDREPTAAAVLHRRGTPAHLDDAAIEVHVAGDGTLGDIDERAAVALLEAAVETARSAGHPRVVMQWDAMDAGGIRRIEGAGFKPKTPPYFELGGGQLEYVMGYRDPAGSTIELMRALSEA
jgi:hypothetical protein